MSGASRVDADRRFMAAALRLARRHLGLTSTNPAVGALIVRGDGGRPAVVGRGVTARGGRPHAETQALAEAGELARGATAYVTLEPCAHHGRTPPCAAALIAAGVSRVVVAIEDPDPRVAGRGVSMLQVAGVEVNVGVCGDGAADQLAGYLARSRAGRPEVTLKLAISRDGMIGRAGAGQLAITSAIARRQVHMIRAESDAIMVGVGTVLADDPQLTVRLPGLGARSPTRIVLDPCLRLPLGSRLAQTAAAVPLWVVIRADANRSRRDELAAAGIEVVAAEIDGEAFDLHAVLRRLAERGISTVLVEGGAAAARHFLHAGLVDRLVLFTGPGEIGPDGVPAPVSESGIPPGFSLRREATFGPDRYGEWLRTG